MIRKLVYEDKEQYIEIMRQFIDERMTEFGIKFDEEQASNQFDLFFKLPEVLVLVLENEGKLVGAVAGVIGPMLFCKGVMIQEMVWYIKPENRGLSSGVKLLRAFEEEAKYKGCTSIIMVGMAEDASNNFYVKDGYQLLQNNYYKELK